ncbi:hypothetical protein JB92DRAFT_3120951 [Gautieria morchelliformis]|nr:hypothetical protein JB92DRAFT_3120951 [Gautieria morchelliformis]
MQESNPFPPDPYGKPPPTLKSATLCRDWCRLTADAREAFWKEHLAGEESETEPESDSSLTSPSKLFQTKIAHAAPVEEDTVRPKPIPSKPTSISVGSTSTKTAKKTANNAITSASPNAHAANDIGDGDAHSNHILTKTGRIDRPLNELPVNTHGRVEIDLAAALKGHAREPGGVGEDEPNDEAGGSPMQSTSRRSQLPQRGRSLKRVSGRKGGGDGADDREEDHESGHVED